VIAPGFDVLPEVIPQPAEFEAAALQARAIRRTHFNAMAQADSVGADKVLWRGRLESSLLRGALTHSIQELLCHDILGGGPSPRNDQNDDRSKMNEISKASGRNLPRMIAIDPLNHHLGVTIGLSLCLLH
jgi:hypothetical protein